MSESAEEIARVAGFVSAKELGESKKVLDRLCEENDISTMVIGSLTFYPKAKLKKFVDQRRVPEDMISAADYEREASLSPGVVRAAIKKGGYPGTWAYGQKSGSKLRSGYFLYAQEADEFFLEPEELEDVPPDNIEEGDFEEVDTGEVEVLDERQRAFYGDMLGFISDARLALSELRDERARFEARVNEVFGELAAIQALEVAPGEGFVTFTEFNKLFGKVTLMVDLFERYRAAATRRAEGATPPAIQAAPQNREVTGD